MSKYKRLRLNYKHLTLLLGTNTSRHLDILLVSTLLVIISPELVSLSAPDVWLQQGSQPKPGVRSVLLVGNPALQLKGFDVAIAVLAAVNQVLPLHITWVCQNQPTAALLPALLASGLRIHLHVDPPQVSGSKPYRYNRS